MFDWIASFFTHDSFVSGALLTLLVIALGLAANRGVKAYFSRNETSFNTSLVAITVSRNLIILVCAITILNIWILELKNFALSMAALGVGILVVNKEILMSVAGYLIRIATGTYATGDIIKIGELTGKVLSYDLLTTTILETGAGELFTGRTARFPNSLLITAVVQNHSATGHYSMESLEVPIGAHEDVIAIADKLEQAGRRVCEDYLSDAAAHFRSIEHRQFVNLPSVTPKVLVRYKDSKEIILTLRYPSVFDSRVKTGQRVLRIFHELIREDRLKRLQKPFTATAE